jgi:glycosyltransferase involved in cell wall biosynthesis
MKISAFTYVRNGKTFGYPFIESIKSLLPIVDEYIVVVGDSTDGTREAVEKIGDDKIKIVDTIWDDNLRKDGKIFAQQANIGLDNTSVDSDWLFHLQADEVIHEKDFPVILQSLEQNLSNKKVDGFLLRFLNFFGDFNHYCPSRRFHQREIRIIRNDRSIRSYKDSMGFRKFHTPELINKKGTKLLVKQIEATIYHYSWSKAPKTQKAKNIEFSKRYHPTDDFIKDFEAAHGQANDYHQYDYLKVFTGTHPAAIQQVVDAQDWEFIYDPSRNNMTGKEKIMKFLETLTGKQFFIYKNYKVKKIF